MLKFVCFVLSLFAVLLHKQLLLPGWRFCIAISPGRNSGIHWRPRSSTRGNDNIFANSMGISRYEKHSHDPIIFLALLQTYSTFSYCTKLWKKKSCKGNEFYLLRPLTKIGCSSYLFHSTRLRFGEKFYTQELWLHVSLGYSTFGLSWLLFKLLLIV